MKHEAPSNTRLHQIDERQKQSNDPILNNKQRELQYWLDCLNDSKDKERGTCRLKDTTSSSIQVERMLLVRRGHVTDNSSCVEDEHLGRWKHEFCIPLRTLQYYASTTPGICNKIVEQ